jgi:hypothetical protein
MSKYLVRDAEITVNRRELLEVLDKAGDVVEVEFEPLGLSSVDKVRIGNAILEGKPDVMSHKTLKLPNFKNEIERFQGDTVILIYNQELGTLKLIGDEGTHFISIPAKRICEEE